MERINQLVREIIPVIIGILIALVINNWNEDRKDKKYLNQIFSSIKSELTESSIDIKESIPRQQVLMDSIEIYVDDKTVSIIDIIEKTEGVSFANVKNNSWKAIANSRIELIEFEKLSALSDIDDGEASLALKQEKILDFIYDNLKNTKQEKKEVFKLLIQDIIWTKESLQLQIEELLED
ncbi:MAG: DUF6090 family protein [Saprospiraceae bacterium]